jgi:hypothetical protein
VKIHVISIRSDRLRTHSSEAMNFSHTRIIAQMTRRKTPRAVADLTV